MEDIDYEANPEWFENLDEDDFKLTFRMSRNTFVSLQAELDDAEDFFNENTDTCLLCCLWILGNTVPFAEAAKVFNIDEEIEPLLLQYFNKISALGHMYLAWPDEEEAVDIEKGFKQKYKFPGVVGVIGSLHINVTPEAKHNFYYNSETKKHTVILQVVCDNDLLLRDVCAGCPGGRDIQTILRSSPLYKKLTDKDEYLVKNNKHLLGGTEHPQMKTLLTPYKGTELTSRQTKFNILHNSVMFTVEKTFRCLENRFPRLTCIETLNPHVATLLISAVCVLHNFTRIRRDCCELFE